MEYNYLPEKDVKCWSSLCISSYGGADLKKVHEQRDLQIDFDQPQLVPHPVYEPPVLSSASNLTRHKSWFKQDPYGQPRQSRTSSLSTLKRPFTSRGKLSISAPTDFRRVTEPMPARRRSFRPLELSIYIEPSGRLSPLPDFLSDDWEKIPGLARPAQALLRRETVDNSQLPSEFTVPRKPLSTYSSYNSRRDVLSEPFLTSLEIGGPGPVITDDGFVEMVRPISDLRIIEEARTPTLPVTQMDDMALSASRPWSQRSSGYTVTRVKSNSRAENGSRPSKGSLRRSKNDTVDEAIRELNIIVEEKRHKAAISSPPLSPTSHVPAIAPGLTVRARSETLNDIGSAFITLVSKPLPGGSSPSAASSRTLTRSPPSDPRLAISQTPSRSVDSSATALPQLPVSNPLQANPVRRAATRKDRLSVWLKRVSNASSEAMPPQKFYQLSAKDVGGFPINRTRSSASIDTISTFSSVSSASERDYATPATTIAPTLSPTTPSRPSISKSPRNLRRVSKRGLSIDTTLSNGTTFTTVPPAYHELDPHPVLANGQVTPSRIGVAC